MDDASVLRIAVCEDDPDDAAFLDDLIEKSGILSECHAFAGGEELLASFGAGRYDLIFMDIYMEGMQGIETVEAIRQTDRNVVIAFITSSLDHALEGFRLNALT
jgi:CheY-like chemotaxis protein